MHGNLALPNGKSGEAEEGGIDGTKVRRKIVHDLKLVYVCSQFRMLSSLNCRAFFFYDSEA